MELHNTTHLLLVLYALTRCQAPRVLHQRDHLRRTDLGIHSAAVNHVAFAFHNGDQGLSICRAV